MIDRDELIARIPGWGADLAPERRPGIPKEKAPPKGTGAHWVRPEQQHTNVKIFHTVERPDITPVFGTACPPKALSGKLRALAYRFGEARLAHWLTLIFADRVDVLESTVGELLRGKPERMIHEMGLRSEIRNGGRYKRLRDNRADSLLLLRRLGLLIGLGSAAVFGARAVARRRRGEGGEMMVGLYEEVA